MYLLLLIFIVTPIVEMWLLITVGGVIGALPTIGLVLLTACIGLLLLRFQGREALNNARLKMQNNELPAREMADTLFFAIGGALLLTPGFITDAIGFACLTPGIRTIIIHFASKHLIQSAKVQSSMFGSRHFSSSASSGPQGPSREAKQEDSKVIEGEFERRKD